MYSVISLLMTPKSLSYFVFLLLKQSYTDDLYADMFVSISVG